VYFAASTDKIHITVPQDLRQTLPGTPDRILDPPRTPAGIKLGGYIDEAIPHCINHIKVGNLGSLEVLLIACDDGDVLAYYTHLFLEELRLQSPQVQASVSSVTPFFHENVGSSAWGLALRRFLHLSPCANVPRRLVDLKVFPSKNVPEIMAYSLGPSLNDLSTAGPAI
jgi:hypothetical protein